MEDKIEELIQGIIKDAEKNGVEVEVHVLKTSQQKKPNGKICFNFKDKDAECHIENIDKERLMVAVHHLLDILTEHEEISFDEAVKLIEKSKKSFDRDFGTKICRSCEEGENVN